MAKDEKEQKDINDKKGILFLSKAVTLGECPRKYWWEYHKQIELKEEKQAMNFGSNFHSYAKIYGDNTILHALAKIAEESNEQTRNSQIELIKGLKSIIDDSELVITSTEQTYGIELPGPYFYKWYVKPDSHFLDKDNKIWLGEYKTTSGYGAATARFYHSSPQTLTYFFIEKLRLAQLGKKIEGTLLFVLVNAKKEQTALKEIILLTKDDEKIAKLFIESFHKYAEQVEHEKIYHRIMTKCHPYRGSACEFLLICHASENLLNLTDYQDRVIQELYQDKDPNEHLGL
jgi:hypothetical protein